MISLRALTKSPIARKIRRHRRPIAAVLAGCSVLLTIAALQPAPPAPIVTNPALTEGEVGAPVTLISASITAAVQPGDVVDVIALDGEPPVPVVVAARVRVVEVRESALLVVAVSAEQALDLASVSIGMPLTVTIYPRNVTSI